MNNDNAAVRLLSILKRAQSVSNMSNQARFCWAQVFDIVDANTNQLTPEQEVELVSRLVQLRTLIGDVEKGLRMIKGINLERYLRPFPRVLNAVKLTELQQQFSSYISPLTEGDFVVLEFCAEKLSEHHVEGVVEEDVLAEMLRDVNDLYENILSSSLNDELKTLILDQLEIIRRAVHEYRIRGIARLCEALPTLVGTYILNKELIEGSAETEEVGKFKNTLGKFASTVAFASNMTKLIEAASRYVPALLPGG